VSPVGRVQSALPNTEDRAAYARRHYNDAVLSYHNLVHTIPSALSAGPFGFRTREHFGAVGEEQDPVTVRF
jgi:LemA protein